MYDYYGFNLRKFMAFLKPKSKAGPAVSPSSAVLSVYMYVFQFVCLLASPSVSACLSLYLCLCVSRSLCLPVINFS